MAFSKVQTNITRGMTTSREKKKTGEITKSISIAGFPIDLHEQIKNMANTDYNVCSIYSDAITTLRADYDSGERFIVQGPLTNAAPGENKSIKVWLHEKADADLRYLVFTLDCFHRHVVYTAIIRWLDKRKKMHQSAP